MDHTTNILHLSLSVQPEWNPSVPVHWSNIHIETIASRQFVQLPIWPAVTEKIADIVWQELALPHVMQFCDKLNQITLHSGYQIDPGAQKVMAGNPHPSVQIHVRYEDNMMTMCCLGRPSGHPADGTMYTMLTGQPDNIK